MPILADAGVPLLVHAELAGPIDAALRRQGNLTDAELTRYVHWLESRRPRGAGERGRGADGPALRARHRGRRAHRASVVGRRARGPSGRRATPGPASAPETWSHYLVFAAEDVPDGATESSSAPLPSASATTASSCGRVTRRGHRDAGGDRPLAGPGGAQVRRLGGLRASVGRHRFAGAGTRGDLDRFVRARASSSRPSSNGCAGRRLASSELDGRKGRASPRAATRTSSSGTRRASASSRSSASTSGTS